MPFQIIVLGVEFFVQTVFLMLALWIMIKFQKLNYNFPGLLGSAALASALDLIPYFGHPASVLVLLLCVWKLTQSEYVDVAFTVFVGYALMFGMNLWLVSMLLGDPRESAQAAGEFPQPKMETMLDETDDKLPVQARTNPAALAETNLTDSLTNVPMSSSNAPGAPLGSDTATAQLSATAQTALKYFSVKGVTRNADKSTVTLHSSVRTYTLFVGDAVLMEIPGGTMAVRLEELGDTWIILDLEGEPVKLSLR